jgi:hypothetical protein
MALVVLATIAIVLTKERGKKNNKVGPYKINKTNKTQLHHMPLTHSYAKQKYNHVHN